MIEEDDDENKDETMTDDEVFKSVDSNATSKGYCIALMYH